MTAEATTRSSAGGRPVVDTTSGPVRGVDDGIVQSWRGVPYAAAPVGELRWRAPEAPRAWSEPLNADR
ncbi:carboxylesterase, partial [Mycobacterium sp. ITM-2017-0098]